MIIEWTDRVFRSACSHAGRGAHRRAAGRRGCGRDRRHAAEFGEDVSTVDEASMPLLCRVADELYEVFADTTLDQCVADLNGMLARWAHPPRLSDHDGTFLAPAPGLRPTTRRGASGWPRSAAYALAAIVAETGRLPGGICHAHDCDRPYLNTGSGGEQRYCSTRCATRSRVAAYRHRHND